MPIDKVQLWTINYNKYVCVCVCVCVCGATTEATNEYSHLQILELDLGILIT